MFGILNPYVWELYLDSEEGQAALEFSIILPPVPPKADHLARWLYYYSICAAFHEFRKANNLSVSELLAFMYGFAMHYISSLPEGELLDPRYVWLLLSGSEKDGDLGWLNRMTQDDLGRWQGNLDMQKGDICIMYVRSTISATHSIWRIVESGYEDPFFHYKHTVQIGHPHKIPAIHFRELAADSVLGNNRYVRANLRGEQVARR